jgi:hypothetical protein
MRPPFVFSLGVLGLACQPAVHAPTKVVAIVPEAGTAAPPPAPSESPAQSVQTPSDYLTRNHGCAKLELSVAEDLLARGNDAIARAGEHPGPNDLDAIIPLLHRAAYGGFEPAQRRYGYYVVGYWYTDEMFWPRSKEIAVSALAMLRVAAKLEGAANAGAYDDELLKALAGDPVTFSETEGPPALPDEWVNAGVEEADQWLRCVQRP